MSDTGPSLWDMPYVLSNGDDNLAGEIERAMEIAYSAGLDDGLVMAQKAVARQCGHTKSVSSNYLCDHDRALAAIDALKERP